MNIVTSMITTFVFLSDINPFSTSKVFVNYLLNLLIFNCGKIDYM